MNFLQSFKSKTTLQWSIKCLFPSASSKICDGFGSSWKLWQKCPIDQLHNQCLRAFIWPTVGIFHVNRHRAAMEMYKEERRWYNSPLCQFPLLLCTKWDEKYPLYVTRQHWIKNKTAQVQIKRLATSVNESFSWHSIFLKIECLWTPVSEPCT